LASDKTPRELKGKLYPWLDEEYGPAPPPWWEREPSQVRRELIEIVRAQHETEGYWK